MEVQENEIPGKWNKGMENRKSKYEEREREIWEKGIKEN